MKPPAARCLALGPGVELTLSPCTFAAAAGNPKAGVSSDAKSAACTPTAAALVYQLMRKIALQHKSLHAKGDDTDNGQPLQPDVAGERAGTTMTMVVNFGTGVSEIRKVNDDCYLDADATSWTRLSSASVAGDAAGRYVKVPVGSAVVWAALGWVLCWTRFSQNICPRWTN